jgi:hypothetical protein
MPVQLHVCAVALRLDDYNDCSKIILLSYK